MSRREYDVVIVGAGLAGAALAARLAQLPLRIALVEAQAIPMGWWPPTDDGLDAYDPRVSALTPTSRQLLESLEAWPAIAERRVSPYREMQVWDAEGTGSIHFEAAEVGCSELGHIVENRLINAALLDVVQDSGRVRCLAESPASGLQQQGEFSELMLENGDALRCRLLVAADGAQSRVRQWAGFETREWDYRQRAIVATIRSTESHCQTAWQRFLPQGPLALLPLSDSKGDNRYCSIVWSADSAYAEQLMALDDSAFCEALGNAFEQRLGAIEACSRRFSFPLQQRHAKDYVKPGIALLGDAAHSIHPLAGQGINLGFQDVAALGAELARASERALPIGSLAVLERYQRRRKGDNLAMMAAMEGFKRLFGARPLPLRWLRNTGMDWVDRSGPLKRQIIRRAMGL